MNSSPGMRWLEPEVLQTERCVLVRRSAEHAQRLIDYKRRNQAHLSPWEPQRAPEHATLEDAVHAAIASAETAYAAGTALHLMALDKQSLVMVADCCFTNIVRGPLQACNMGYSVDLEHQGSGLMYEVSNAAIGYLFDTLGLHRIMASHVPHNTRSESLLRRLGFEREGFARSYLKIAGKWEDMVLNALIHPDPEA